MGEFGFCGGSYRSQSVNADCQTTMNLYPESDESGLGNSAIVMYHTPGTKLFAGLPEGPVRGQFAQTYGEKRGFVVAGGGLYELLPETPPGWKLIGKLNNGVSDGSTVSMVANSASQLLICSMGVLYVFNFGTNVLTAPIADLGPYSRVFFLDGFFLALIANSQKYQFSALEDGTTWSDLDVVQVEVFTDNIVGGIVDHEEFWTMGETQSLPNETSSDFNNPFTAVKQGVIQQGLGAVDSIVQLDNTVMWIGKNQQGQGVGWRLQGYTPTRITTHAIETAWQNKKEYPTIADAIGYAYQDQGHSFWVIYFPSADKTWVYDVATNLWHERGKWEANLGKFTAHRSRNYMFWQGKHLVGDWKTGNVYEMSIEYNYDLIALDGTGGDFIRRLRRAPHVSTEQQWMYHEELQIFLEAGLGPPINLAPDGTQYIYVSDELGAVWRSWVDDNGILQSQMAPLEVPALYFLTSPTGLWLLQVESSTARLQGRSIANMGQSTQPYIQFLSVPSQVPWQLRIEIGENRLQTIRQGTYPQRGPELILRYSNDSGHTWSNERRLNCGHVGQFKTRVIARRLGRARDRVYEISYTDPVALRIVDAYLRATPGFDHSGRIPKELQKRA